MIDTTTDSKSVRAMMWIVILLITQIAISAEAEPVKPDAVYTYHSTPQRDLTLDLYDPGLNTTARQAEMPADLQKRPAVIFFFGGGWNGGSTNHFARQAQAYADLGFVAFCPDYRVAKRDETPPMDAVADALQAVAWVRANAERFNIDPDRIAVGGGSAGGHLAAACATVPENKLADLAPQGLPASPRPNALLLFNAVIDNGPGASNYGYDRVGDDYVWFSPSHNVREELPPTIILQGTQDKLIPVSVAENFKDSMEKHGNRCDIVLYEGVGHGFFNQDNGPDSPYRETLGRTVEFIRSLGWTEPE